MSFNKRATVVDGWAVTDNEDGSQTRARLVLDQCPMEPERGDGMWNEGVSLVREEKDINYYDIDSHDGLESVMDRIMRLSGLGWVVLPAMWDTEPTILGSDEKMRTFVKRYLSIFWGVQYAERFIVRDDRYSYAVWGIAENIEDGANIPAIVRSTMEEWVSWASGDVYMVESQDRTLSEAMEHGEDWSEIMSDSEYMGGCYGDESGREGIAEALGVSVDDVPNAYEITVYP